MLAPVSERSRKIAQAHQGMAQPGLQDHEDGEQRRRQHRQQQRRARNPAGGLGVDEGVDQGHQAAGDGDGAGDVDPPRGGRCPALGHEAQREQQGRGADREVDEEHPLPGGKLGEDPTQQQTDRAAADGDRAPDPQGPGPVPALGEGGGQHREGGRRHQRTAQALQGTSRHQLGRRPGEAVEQRGCREERDADHEEPAPAEEITGASAEQEKPAEGQRVGIDHPLEVPGGEVEAALDRGQRHIHDGRVQDHHELGEADDDEDRPGVDTPSGHFGLPCCGRWPGL